MFHKPQQSFSEAIVNIELDWIPFNSLNQINLRETTRFQSSGQPIPAGNSVEWSVTTHKPHFKIAEIVQGYGHPFNLQRIKLHSTLGRAYRFEQVHLSICKSRPCFNPSLTFLHAMQICILYKLSTKVTYLIPSLFMFRLLSTLFKICDSVRKEPVQGKYTDW